MADADRKKVVPQVQVTNRAAMDELLSLDPESLDSNMHYRFVKDSPLRVSRHKLRGYQPVTRESGVMTNVDPEPSEDGLIRIGDVILMACPRSTREAREAGLREINENRLGSYRIAKRDLKGIAEKGEYDVPVYTEGRGGRETRSRLRGRNSHSDED